MLITVKKRLQHCWRTDSLYNEPELYNTSVFMAQSILLLAETELMK